MTTTDVEVYTDPEAVEVQALSKTEAKRLDKRIRATGDKAVTSHSKTLELFDELMELLTQARDGEIHKALGLKSWTAYIADAVNIQVTVREDRKALAQFLSGQGMSQRAIASTLGVSQKTVDRDLEGEESDPDATVESLDGAERPKNGKVNDDNVIDAEVVEEEPQEDAPMAAVDIVSEFADEVANLWAAHSQMNELMGEDKWGNARKRIAKANLNNIQTVIESLTHIVDDLMTE